MGSLPLEDFAQLTEKVVSITRRLESIGEATKRVLQELRDKYPEIPWRAMAGMRERLIHGYDEEKIDQLYQLVTQVIPPLIPLTESILISLPEVE